MNITDVNVRILQKEESSIKAVASITIDSCFVVHDIKVLQGDTELFIAMPSRKMTDGTYRDIAHPINKQTRAYIQDVIFAKYNEVKDIPIE